MRTPWEKYIEEAKKDNPCEAWADYAAWEKWFHEDDQEDVLTDVDVLASTHIYWKFNVALKDAFNSMNVGDFRTVKGCYELTPDFEFLGFHCNECKSIMLIAEDPVREQPGYCYNCGVKFDWQDVYEEACKEVFGETNLIPKGAKP